METDNPVPQVVRFGPYEVNLRTGELRKRGIRISLQEQPLRILAALLDAPGETVTRQELCRRLWPEGTFVDFEHSLNAAVRRLRVTLGDEAGIPRFIETVPRRGYRFLATNEAFPRPIDRPDRSGVRAAGPTGHGRCRLAVIPFASFSGNGVLTDALIADGFADGLIDETITQLARVAPPHVGVIARTSVTRLAGTDRSAAEIGRALGADYLVEGAIRREGTRIRITAQLIESEEETHLWAASYDRVTSDSFSLQTEVAEAIATAVVNSLTQSRSAAVGF